MKAVFGLQPGTGTALGTALPFCAMLRALSLRSPPGAVFRENVDRGCLSWPCFTRTCA